MDAKTVKKGDILARKNGPVDTLLYITGGTVSMVLGSREIPLGKGDLIGLADIESGIHSCDYVATSDVSVMVFTTRDNLYKSDFLSAKPDNCRAIAMSVNRIARSSFRILKDASDKLNGLLALTARAYAEYRRFASELHTSPREMEQVTALPESVSVDFRQSIIDKMNSGMYTFLADKTLGQKMVENGTASGYILHCSSDFRDICPEIEAVTDNISACVDICMNENGDDLYGRLANLFIRATSEHALAAPITDLMNEIYVAIAGVSRETADIRRNEIDIKLAAVNGGSGGKGSGDGVDKDIASRLIDSMDTIFGFCNYPAQKAEELKAAVSAFRKVTDPYSSDEEIKKLRMTIEEHFYYLYLSVLEARIECTEVPVIIKMFLEFGYLDEELAGMDNACELYNIALTFEGDRSKGVFTASEWLLAIFTRDREPSINEFDQSFEEYVRDQRNNGNINDAQVRAILKDQGQKVMFEMQNMFRKASRICSGQVLSFCPVFCSFQLLRSLKDDVCDANKLTESLGIIRSIDYSLFYREKMHVFNEKEGIYDTIHVEVMPDMILMPVIGSRTVMWQEICGKDRMTPGRFVLPVVLTDDLDKQMIKLSGEFRWELCKRIQGARWNDVTDPSITSLYSDYLQFYRKNSELSAEQKEKVKTGLQRYKQVYRDFFVADYAEYIKYESAGSPHLNKVARSILFMQCPFRARVRSRLKDNPIYGEVSDKYRIKTGQQLHKLDNIAKKLTSHGYEVPKELKAEIEYYNL